MRRAPGLLAGLLALALTVTGCSGGGDGDPGSRPTGGASSGTEAPSADLATLVNPAEDISEERLTELLAGAGIATYADPADSEPVVPVTDPGPVAVTGWQLANMRNQLASGRGYLGRDLDELTADTGAGPQPVPFSVVLAAWVSAADTPGAEAARELTGERDWAHHALDLTYSDALIMLFTADLTREGARAAAAPSASPAAYVAAPAVGTSAAGTSAAGTCSMVATFMQDTFAAVVQTLKFEADGGVTGVLATIWNTVVDIAAEVAQVALGAVTSSLTEPIMKVAGVVALLASASSLLNPWQVQLAVTPTGNLQPGTDAEATATVDPGEKVWPEDVVDCAQVLLGVTLPEPGDAQGSKAVFSVQDVDQTVTYGTTSTTVDAAQQAELPFSTLPEDPALATGKETLHYVAIGVDVERAQVEQLVAMIDGLVVSALPEPVLSLVNLVLGDLKSATRAKLAELTSVEGPVSTLFTVRHEPPDDPPVTAPPTPEPSCAVGAAAEGIPDGTWSGPIELDVVGSGANLDGTVGSGGSGTMTLTSAGGKVTGSWEMGWSSKGTLKGDGVTVKVTLSGAVMGGASGKATKPQLDYTYSIQGSAVATAMGVTQKVPIKESGSADQFLTVVESDCDGVVATFVPSFNSKTNPAGIQISGTATWNGSPA